MVNDVNEQLIIRYFNDIVSNKEIILVEWDYNIISKCVLISLHLAYMVFRTSEYRIL
jgi:hypothetical protein